MNDKEVAQTRTSEDEAATNVVPFRRRATGGGFTTPPGGSGTAGNWLAGLEMGARFLAKRFGSYPDSEVEDYVICNNLGEGVILLAKNYQGVPKYEWHDSGLFSKANRLYLVLEVVKDDDNKPLQLTRVARDEESPEPGEFHEEQ